MAKISSLPQVSAVDDNDIIPVVDVDDITQAPTGTTKKISVSQLRALMSPSLATALADGLMTAAHFSKLTALPVNDDLEDRFNALELLSHDELELDTSDNTWLGLVGQTLKLTLVNADASNRGLVSTGVQTFAGAKTFTGAVYASGLLDVTGNLVARGALYAAGNVIGDSAGNGRIKFPGGSPSLHLLGVGGASSTDVLVKVGTENTDASVHASAKLWSARTAIGGSESEKAYIFKDGTLVNASGGVGFGSHVYGRIGWTFGDCGGAVGWISGNQGAFLMQSVGTGIISASHGMVGPSFQGEFFATSTIQLNTTGVARPAADASSRGKLWYSKSAGGVADTLEVCVKSAADAYSWAPLPVTGGELVTTSAQTYSGAKRGAVVALTSSAASVAVNLAQANNYSHTLTENTTLAAPTNASAGQSGVIVFTQDATTARTLGFNSFWKFPGGTVPTLSTTLGAVDVLSYYVVGSFAICSLIKDLR